MQIAFNLQPMKASCRAARSRLRFELLGHSSAHLCLNYRQRSSAAAEIAQVGGHYAVEGHSRSLIFVKINLYIVIILTYILSLTVSN